MNLKTGVRAGIAVAGVALLAIFLSAVLAQSDTRSVEGLVSDQQGAPVPGAVVKLEDTRTLSIRSYITQQDGKYYFRGLAKTTDYSVKAEYQGKSSGGKTVSKFDSRDTAVVNLKISG
jgi:hypothetical protein